MGRHQAPEARLFGCCNGCRTTSRRFTLGFSGGGYFGPVESLAGLFRDAKKRRPVAIGVAEKDAAPLVTARRHVIERAGEFQPEV